MYNVSQYFIQAVNNGALQHIRGTLRLVGGTEVQLGDDNIVGQPSVETQITEDPDTFNIAELYIGTLDITLKTDLGEHDLYGSEITIESGVDVEEGGDENGIEWIPMGVWDCKDAVSQGIGSLKITGYDHIARLQKEIPRQVGLARISHGMAKVAQIADVEFAQTYAELNAFVPFDLNRAYSAGFSATCWEEVRSIAQVLGCYVIADREGKISFRRYYSAHTAVIDADHRHNISINRYSFGVSAFEYTDAKGQTARADSQGRSTSSVVVIPESNRFYRGLEIDSEYMESFLDNLADEFRLLYWWSGTVNCYNNPALDAGDIVMLSGGAIGSDTKAFLITANYWQFRGAQTLISGGAPRAGDAVSSGSSGGGVYSSTVVNAVNPLITDHFTAYKGQLYGVPRTAARGRISSQEKVDIFITCTMQLVGNEDSDTVKAAVSVGAETLEMQPETTLADEQKAVLNFTFPVTLSGGYHDIRVTADGFGELSGVSACVWGQNIKEEALTYSEDYTYETEEGEATVTGYSGGEVNIEIPEKLGGSPVKTIGDTAFTNNSDIETVYIPDGVEAIL